MRPTFQIMMDELDIILGYNYENAVLVIIFLLYQSGKLLIHKIGIFKTWGKKSMKLGLIQVGR